MLSAAASLERLSKNPDGEVLAVADSVTKQKSAHCSFQSAPRSTSGSEGTVVSEQQRNIRMPTEEEGVKIAVVGWGGGPADQRWGCQD